MDPEPVVVILDKRQKNPLQMGQQSITGQHAHTFMAMRNLAQPVHHPNVFGQWEGTRVPRGNPQEPKENMLNAPQTVAKFSCEAAMLPTGTLCKQYNAMSFSKLMLSWRFCSIYVQSVNSCTVVYKTKFIITKKTQNTICDWC